MVGDNVKSLMAGAIARLMRLVLAVTAAVTIAGFTTVQSERAMTSELREACDFAYSVAAKTPGVSIHRRTGTFQDETLAQPVRGCGLDISGSFAKAERTEDAAVRLRQAYEAAGWEEMADYGADGKDGTSFAFRKGRVSCFARGTWNGGADEPDLPGEDWYKVKIFCATPVFPERQLLERIVIIVPKDGWRLMVTPDGAARPRSSLSRPARRVGRIRPPTGWRSTDPVMSGRHVRDRAVRACMDVRDDIEPRRAQGH